MSVCPKDFLHASVLPRSLTRSTLGVGEGERRGREIESDRMTVAPIAAAEESDRGRLIDREKRERPSENVVTLSSLPDAG